jgi:hypothetical protein
MLSLWSGLADIILESFVLIAEFTYFVKGIAEMTHCRGVVTFKHYVELRIGLVDN